MLLFTFIRNFMSWIWEHKQLCGRVWEGVPSGVEDEEEEDLENSFL